MKHLKVFETWTSTATDDVNVNYGDKKPEFSDIVKFTVEYIEDNFDDINSIDLDYMQVDFSLSKNGVWADNWKEEYKKITINKKNQNKYTIYYITFEEGGGPTSTLSITKDEYDYLCEFIYNIDIEYKKIKEKEKLDKVISKIDPVRRSAKKYNL